MRRAAALAALLLAMPLAGCLAPPAPPAGPADLVVHNGAVWTGDAPADGARAVAVRDGRIVLVGADAEALALRGPATRVVDARGGFVGPAFRDQHAHVLEVAADGDAATMAPRYAPYDPVQAELGRQQVGAYHLRTKAQASSPMDGCSTGPVTPELRAGILAAQDEALRQGLGAVVEPGLHSMAAWDALQELDREGQLKLRFLVRFSWGCLEPAAQRGLRTGAGSDWVRVLGVKLYADGWLGPRTCALREPYSDRPLSQGILFLEPERARRDVARARELGFHVGAHAIGDRAVEVMLDAYEAAGAGPGDRWSLEHVQVLAPDLVDRMAAMGVVGTIQLSFATSDMRFAESALGPERIRWAYPWRTAQERGLRLAGSSDFPIEVLAPLWGLQRTVTRQELDGTPPGGWRPGERLGLDAALRLVTLDAAFASLEEHERGALAPGMRADLVVLREDIRAGPPEAIAGATVVLTVVNGQVGFEGAQAYPPRARAASSAAAEAFAASAATKGSTPSSTAAPSGT